MTAARVFRYEVPIGDDPVTVDLSGEPLAVGCRDPRVVEFWATSYDGAATRPRRFLVVGTGHPLPDRCRYWGTAVAPPLPGGVGVWHLYEVTL